MAYDKVIDSGKLDGAMTATANAIRAKTGGTENLAWDEANGFKSAVEDIPTGSDPVIEPLEVTENGTYTAPSGTDGYSPVTVAVPTAEQATPSITVSSAGLITASAEQSAGYVAAGTKSATKQLTVQAAKTITPSTSSQTAVAKDRYTTGAVTVAAIPSTYVKPTATKAATTYTPGTSDQTIAAGTYCSGAQTIKGDAKLLPENIKAGVTIFDMLGTYSGGDLKYSKGLVDTDIYISTSAGNLICSLTGLTFKPKFVLIYANNMELDLSGNYENLLAQYNYNDTMKDAIICNGETAMDFGGNIHTITLTDDGFRFTSGAVSSMFPDSYNYIAIG